MKNQFNEMLPEERLELVEVAPSKDTTEANETRLRELERELDTAARCGGLIGGGCSSPTSAKWYEMFCPGYGQN